MIINIKKENREADGFYYPLVKEVGFFIIVGVLNLNNGNP